MIFDKLFNRKKEEPNPFGRTVRDLDLGYIFEYNLKSWEVAEVYEYDWGDNNFTKEFKVTDGQSTKYLTVDEDDELEIVLADKISIRKVQSDLQKVIMENETPPETLKYENREYHLDEECPGYFRKLPSKNDEDWEEFIAWEYYDDDEQYTLTIEQWGDRSFDAAHGKLLKEFEISDILPSTKGKQ